MYVPAHFRVDNPAELRRFMRAHSFATLVTADGSGTPFATHLPLLVEEDDGPGGALSLRSHVARANPHWRHFLTTEAETLAIFHGPHALVHANWYDSAPNVPTWNYAVAHAYGRARVIEDAATARGIAYRLVAQHTPDLRAIPPEFEARLLAAVVTFEIPVARVEGKQKLSQNKTPADRANVARELAASPDETDRRMAALMHPDLI